MPQRPPGQLTPKQAKFVLEYLTDLNGTQAAIRAGYNPRTARFISSENLTKPYIQAALTAERTRLAQRLALTPERVLQEYARIAFADLRRVVTWDATGGRAVDAAALDADDAAALAEVSIVVTEQGETRTVRTRVKLHDKKGALDSLAKHLKLFDDVPPALPDVHVHLHAARDRLSARLDALAQRHAEEATNGH